MDDASLMDEILNRPEAELMHKALGAMANLNNKKRESEHSTSRLMGLYAEKYHADDGGTDINEAREVHRLIQQRQDEVYRITEHSKSMARFIQRNKQNLGFDF